MDQSNRPDQSQTLKPTEVEIATPPAGYTKCPTRDCPRWKPDHLQWCTTCYTKGVRTVAQDGQSDWVPPPGTALPDPHGRRRLSGDICCPFCGRIFGLGGLIVIPATMEHEMLAVARTVNGGQSSSVILELFRTIGGERVGLPVVQHPHPCDSVSRRGLE